MLDGDDSWSMHW